MFSSTFSIFYFKIRRVFPIACFTKKLRIPSAFFQIRNPDFPNADIHETNQMARISKKLLTGFEKGRRNPTKGPKTSVSDTYSMFSDKPPYPSMRPFGIYRVCLEKAKQSFETKQIILLCKNKMFYEKAKSHLARIIVSFACLGICSAMNVGSSCIFQRSLSKGSKICRMVEKEPT